MAADRVLLTKSPRKDISAMRAIDTVVTHGQVCDRTTLDKMLADTRARVAAWNAEVA